MRVKNCLLLSVALSGGLTLSATAQTGRIALASHAGRVAEADDNFGIVPRPTRKEYTRLTWKTDTVTYLSDSMAIHSGLMMAYYRDGKPAANWHRAVEIIQKVGGVYYKDMDMISSSLQHTFTLDSLRKWYPKATVVGADKLKKPASKKSSGHMQVFPKRPFQYSYWRGLASVAALGAVGWLLGKKRAA